MDERPKNLHTTKSFTRLESTQKSSLHRKRASTLSGPPIPDILDPLKEQLSPENEDGHNHGDIFASQGGEEAEHGQEQGATDAFEELPIEIRSLTERYCITEILERSYNSHF
jgi:hypothetical protein